MIDITAFPVEEGENAWSAPDAWERFHRQGLPGRRPDDQFRRGWVFAVFDENGEMVTMDFATSAGLPETLLELVSRGHGLERILPAMTSNVARLSAAAG